MTFNRSRVKVGRALVGLTQRELADRISVAASVVGEIESGTREPRGSALDALALVLEVEPEFFFEDDLVELREEHSNFRSRISASERLKKQVLARASLFATLLRHVRPMVPVFPAFDVPIIRPRSLDDVERVAADARRHWGLDPDAPLGTMVMRLIERAGVVPMSIDCETAEKIDAFSSYGDINLVVLNSEKGSVTRTTFDAAHELAHGIMHRDCQTPFDRKEEEAHRFASALLLPATAFSEEFSYESRTDWSYLLELKARWGVSLASIIFRAFQLQLIDVVTYRNRWRDLSRRAWRKAEPDEPEPVNPQLLSDTLVEWRKATKRSLLDLVDELRWTPTLFNKVTGIVLPKQTMDGVLSIEPHLRRVAGS
ncbi:MAG: ImmA/IrrE family metallo-endopeptidase [Gemmatimonadetes bacterium]|nr:ImmA/IrrE family metallo-endopeptidase [Gemmatimonadota bacterium]